MSITEFDWADTGDILLPEQPETAAYFNARGDLVIRQRCYPHEDKCIIVANELVDTFIDRLTDALGIASVP